MSRSIKRLVILCIALILLSGCTIKIHYDTFDELLTSKKISNEFGDERESHGVILFQSNEYLGFPTFYHLNEYDYLSENILEFVGEKNWDGSGGVWYYPEGGDSGEFLIFVSNEGKASIWKREIGYGVND